MAVCLSVESKCIYYSNKEDAAIHKFVCVVQW